MSIKGWTTFVKTLCVIAPSLIIGLPIAQAEGTDILNPPAYVVVADGSRIIGAGVGLAQNQPGNIEIEIPPGVSVEQVLLYWDGDDAAYAGAPPVIGVTTDTIKVFDDDVVGIFIGGRTYRTERQLFAFRADITALGRVAPGSNTLEISGLDFGTESLPSGAGVLVIVDDGFSSTLEILDGSDFAYANCKDPDTPCFETEKRMLTFPAATTARDAELTMFFASVSGTASGGGFRPSTIRIWVGGAAPIEIVNELDSTDGQEWDTLNVEFEVPAGVSYVEVQAFSEDLLNTGNNPASFKWLTAALSVPDELEGGQGCTPGYWKQDHHFADWTAPYDPDDLFSDHFEDAFPGSTLVEVADGNGGGLTALGRHTVAALLNAANPEVSYDLTPQQVIDNFNQVYPGSKDDYEDLKDWFEDFNEQGCPLNNSDGSNGNGNGNGNPTGNATGNSNSGHTASGSEALSDQGTSGGGILGIWEMLALFLLGWSARQRAHRRGA